MKVKYSKIITFNNSKCNKFTECTAPCPRTAPKQSGEWVMNWHSSLTAASSFSQSCWGSGGKQYTSGHWWPVVLSCETAISCSIAQVFATAMQLCTNSFTVVSNCTHVAFVRKRLVSLKYNDKRILSGVKPYMCYICKKAFSVTVIWRHKLIYSGVKLYTCGICKKAFSVAEMWRHKHIYSGVKPYMCDICKKAFSVTVIWRHKLI